MLRREFMFNTAAAGAGLMLAGGLNSCVGTYNPKIINALWDEKFVFDSPDKALLMRQLVRCGVVAPSGHNTQPWFFKISENKIEIMPDYSRRLPVVDRFNRELFISLGAALENIIIAAPAFGFFADYSIDETKGKEKIIIEFSLNRGVSRPELFQPMLDRQTTRNNYTKKPLPAGFHSSLGLDEGDSTGYFVSEEKKDFDLFLDYVKRGNHLLYGKKEFLEELKKWIRWNDKEAEETLDGLYIRALGESSSPAWFGKMMFNLSVTPKTMDKKEEEFINSASSILLLFAEDGTKNWIETGRKMQSILMRVSSAGMKYAFHNQPAEAMPLREALARDFGSKGLKGQVAIRIGWSEAMPRSPRRKINDVIIS